MSAIVWTETTAEWARANPYRRYEGWHEGGGVTLWLERELATAGTWHWTVFARNETQVALIPGGDLPDDEAKRLAPVVLVAQLRRLLEALS